MHLRLVFHPFIPFGFCSPTCTAAHPRAATLEAILEAEPVLKDSIYDLSDRSITNQVRNALSVASQNEEILVVCGSVFLMAEAREALGFDEPRDSDYVSKQLFFSKK